MKTTTKRVLGVKATGLTNEEMWEVYAQGIAQAMGLPNTGDNFVLTGNSLIANLAAFSKALPPSAIPTVPQALAQVYALGNTQIVEQGIYTQSMNRFFSEYATYIDGLIPPGAGPTPTQESQIRLLQQSLIEANAVYDADLQKALAAWKLQGEAFPGKYPTFQSFVNQSAWGQTLNTDTSVISGYNSQLNSLLTEIFGDKYLAIQTNKQVVDNVRTGQQGTIVFGPSVMEVNTDAGNMIVPRYDPSSLSTFSSWVDSTIAQHGKATPIKIDFTQSAGKYDFSKSSYFRNTNFKTNYFFFSASGGTSRSGTKVDIDTSSSSFKCTLMFDAITNVQLAPGVWLDTSLLYDYKNPKNLSIPSFLVIGMYPSIELEMDAASFSSAYAAYNSGGGFGIGSFWASASHSQGSSELNMSAEWDQSSNKVKIVGASVMPVILGMQVVKPSSNAGTFEVLKHSRNTIG